MIGDLSGLGILGWFVVGVLCVGLAAAAVLATEEVVSKVQEVRERRVMAILNVTPMPLYPGLPTDLDHRMPTTADVFALAAILRGQGDEFDAWLADRSLCTFDEFCEAVAMRRLHAPTPTANAGQSRVNWPFHWGPDWNGNESSGGL